MICLRATRACHPSEGKSIRIAMLAGWERRYDRGTLLTSLKLHKRINDVLLSRRGKFAEILVISHVGCVHADGIDCVRWKIQVSNFMMELCPVFQSPGSTH